MKPIRIGDGPRPLRESDLLREVKRFLTLLRNEGRLTFRRIHVTAIPRSFGKQQFSRFSKNTEMAGMEDFQVYLPGGKTLFLELKSGTGKQSPAQKVREHELKRLGHDYVVIQTQGTFFGILKRHGINHWSFPKGEND